MLHSVGPALKVRRPENSTQEACGALGAKSCFLESTTNGQNIPSLYRGVVALKSGIGVLCVQNELSPENVSLNRGCR